MSRVRFFIGPYFLAAIPFLDLGPEGEFRPHSEQPVDRKDWKELKGDWIHDRCPKRKVPHTHPATLRWVGKDDLPDLSKDPWQVQADDTGYTVGGGEL